MHVNGLPVRWRFHCKVRAVCYVLYIIDRQEVPTTLSTGYVPTGIPLILLQVIVQELIDQVCFWVFRITW